MATNIPFLQAVLDDPDFRAGRLTTSFIETHPQLLTARSSADRGTKLLTYLADVTINQPYGARPVSIDPRQQAARTWTCASRRRPGHASACSSSGRPNSRASCAPRPPVAVTDTTFRDAHQSLLATRVRTRDMLNVAGHVARTLPELLSLEAWGGATYDVALRFLAEDPWQRLADLRTAVPNICLQMLLRGRNTVGYTPYPAAVTEAFVEEAAATGVDIFRIFDALNDVSQMRPAIDAVRATGTAVAEVALCYTGDLSDPAERLYTLDYYLRLAEQIVDAGAHILAIKDMAGLLRAPAARTLVTALRERFDLPVHLHTHDTPGGQLATLLAAIDAGVDAVDAANAAMSGTTSQPSLSSLVAATDYAPRETGLSLRAACDLEPYWEATRRLYAPFESGLPAPTGRVYRHEIPGGQLSNLRQQAIALGLGEKFEQIEDMYAAANDILGNIVKVTPSSKVVGDLALHLVAVGADPRDFAENPGKYDIPDSVIGFLSGDLGDPPGGWPEPFRTRALAGRSHARPGHRAHRTQEKVCAPTGGAPSTGCCSPGRPASSRSPARPTATCPCSAPPSTSTGCSPGASTSVTIEEGKTLLFGLQSVGPPDERGIRIVMCTINGQLRPIPVRDRAVEPDAPAAEKADPASPGQIAAPFGGSVTPTVALGDQVAAGRHRGQDRGDEDGGLHHHPGRRNRYPRRAGRHRPARRRRPHPGDRLTLGPQATGAVGAARRRRRRDQPDVEPVTFRPSG